METSIDRSEDDKIVKVFKDEIDAIVDRYGGHCWGCGPVASHYVPFEEGNLNRYQGTH